MGKPNKDKKKREQKRLAEKKDPELQAKRKAEKQEQLKENIKHILLFIAKALLPAVASVIVFSLIYKSSVAPGKEAFSAVGFIGAAVFGAGISLFIYGKNTYKILAPIGLALSLLSYILISNPKLTGENAVAFYNLNILFALIFPIFYFWFRDAVHSWLRGRKISDTMIRKSRKGAKNFWWFEELHRNFGLSAIYTLNKIYTIFFAVHFTASVLLGWAEPLFRIFAVSYTLLALLTSYMAEFSRMQRTIERYGCKFVLCKLRCRHGKIIDSSILDIIASLFPVGLAALFWHMINSLT